MCSIMVSMPCKEGYPLTQDGDIFTKLYRDRCRRAHRSLCNCNTHVSDAVAGYCTSHHLWQCRSITSLEAISRGSAQKSSLSKALPVKSPPSNDKANKNPLGQKHLPVRSLPPMLNTSFIVGIDAACFSLRL